MTQARAVAAVLTGALVCCAFIAGYFALRYRGAFGVFTVEDWTQLLPEVRGWVIDYALGLALGIGMWAVLSAERRNGLAWAVGAGALSMFVAPQIIAVLYVMSLPIPIDWGGMMESALRRAALPLLVGAVAGAIMWRVAYGGRVRLA
jgi:hypothetical protein